MLSWLRRFVKGEVQIPKHPELDERERHLDEKLLRATGLSPATYLQEQRRRRLALEAGSYRRR